MNFVKKQNIFGWATCVAAVLALIGLILYIVTSTTGYLAGTDMNPVPVLLSIFVIIGAFALVLFSDKIGKRVSSVILVVLAVMVAITFCVFVIARVDVIGDVYFIPVNFPEAEGATVSNSIVGFVFYGLSFISLLFAAFGEKLNNA